jgi:hypothetical protein
VSSVVLLLLVGGLVDIGRSIYVSEALSNAAREGARHGIWYDAPSHTHPYLNDTAIKTAVDQGLTADSLPASSLQAGCPTAADGNAAHNPPYVSGAYPSDANVPWLYICYPPVQAGGQDLNVIVLYTYGPLTPIVKSQFGGFQVAVNQHMTVQGS